MKKIKLVVTAWLFALAGLAAAFAQEPAAPSGPETELRALVEKISAKIDSGERSAEALAPELKAFEELETKYAADKSKDAARIHFMHALLFAQVLNDVDRAKEILTRMKRDFTDPEVVEAAESAIAQFDQQAKAAAAKQSLAGKPAPELNFAWSSREGLGKLSDLKGKVVVIDFWATWCGPCVASFPNVRELTAHYKDLDVVVLGVTSLQGRVHGLEAKPVDTSDDPQKEYALMRDYIKAKDITWTVAFSREEVFNPDYGVEGIPHMVIVAPDGTVRHPNMDPRDPHEEKIAKIDALLKEFGKPTSKKAI